MPEMPPPAPPQIPPPVPQNPSQQGEPEELAGAEEGTIVVPVRVRPVRPRPQRRSA